MKTIKFRAWDKTENKWYENHYGLMVDGESGEVMRNEVSIEKNEVILMQYTGLKDKNGKEIYEGDVVKSIGKYIQKVVYKEENDGDDRAEFFHVGFSFSGTNGKDLEVIGNLWENPGLINK